MSGRRPLIAGNWKMNTTLTEATELATGVRDIAEPDVDIVICPPFPWLLPVRKVLEGSSVALGAQNCWPQPSGAFTGEVSVSMLAGLCEYVIVGHSERRQWGCESDELVREKVTAVLHHGMTPILCVGESLETRQQGNAAAFVTGQLTAALGNRSAAEIRACVVAYEPIWAIGTGVAASAQDAEAMCLEIRQVLDGMHAGIGQDVRILYGGSVNPANSGETLRQPNVDGALVGGACLKPESFAAIVRSAAR